MPTLPWTTRHPMVYLSVLTEVLAQRIPSATVINADINPDAGMALKRTAGFTWQLKVLLQASRKIFSIEMFQNPGYDELWDKATLPSISEITHTHTHHPPHIYSKGTQTTWLYLVKMERTAMNGKKNFYQRSLNLAFLSNAKWLLKTTWPVCLGL